MRHKACTHIATIVTCCMYYYIRSHTRTKTIKLYKKGEYDYNITIDITDGKHAVVVMQ